MESQNFFHCLTSYLLLTTMYLEVIGPAQTMSLKMLHKVGFSCSRNPTQNLKICASSV